MTAVFAKPPASSFPAQQKRFDRYRKHFNEDRPHEALNMQPPASVYETSPRSCPQAVPDIEHPTAQTIIRVFADGGAVFQRHRLYLGTPFAHQTVGIVEQADDIYVFRYGSIYLGFLDTRPKEPRWFQAP